MPISSKYLFMVSMDVDPEKEALFNEVYDTEHVPHILQVPGVRGATRMAGEAVHPQHRRRGDEEAARGSALHRHLRDRQPRGAAQPEWAKQAETGRWPGQVRPFTRNRQPRHLQGAVGAIVPMLVIGTTRALQGHGFLLPNMRITVQTKSGEFSFDCEPTERHPLRRPRPGAEAALRMRHRHLRHLPGPRHAGRPPSRVGGGAGLRQAQAREGRHPDVSGAPHRRLRLPRSRQRRRQAGQPDAAGAPHGPHREAVRRLTADVLDFEVRCRRPMTFDAGQFVVLEAPASRAAAPIPWSTSGAAVDRLKLVVKQKAGGRFCDWLFKGDVDGQRGQRVRPARPRHFNPQERRNILCIAGGSGIAGMLAILEHATRENYFRDHAGHVISASARWPTVSICRSCRT